MKKFKQSEIESLQCGQDIYVAMETAAQPDMIQVCADISKKFENKSIPRDQPNQNKDENCRLSFIVSVH